MSVKKGWKVSPLSFGRRAVAASASVTGSRSVIHSMGEADITEVRRIIREYQEKEGVKLSLTAYLTACLCRVVEEFPQVNALIRGRKVYSFDELTVSVLMERNIGRESVPEPLAIQGAQAKPWLAIHHEIRAAQNTPAKGLGDLSGSRWFGLIPSFLLKAVFRMADRSPVMAAKYGRVAVTAVGMNSHEPLWFVPHGTANVLLTVGSISRRAVETPGGFEFRDHICLTLSFDHDYIDGAPAARFMSRLLQTVRAGLPVGLLPERQNQ